MRYTAYGLSVESEIELPELLLGDVDADVCIRYGEIAGNTMPFVCGRNRIWQGQPGKFLMQVKRIGRFLVEQGKTITIDRHQQATNDDLRFVLLGSIFGVLLQQRQLLALHASSVITSSGAMLFAGPSGYGKSTIAAALAARNYRVLSDDVTALTCQEQGPMALPAFPRLRLWQDSLAQLNLDSSSLPRARVGLNKYLPQVSYFHQESAPLARIYLLGVHHQPSIDVQPLRGAAKVMGLINNTYRADFLLPQGLVQHHYQQIMSVAEQVEAYQIHRPLQSFLLNELVDRLEAHWC